jgi:hypothetical protein
MYVWKCDDGSRGAGRMMKALSFFTVNCVVKIQDNCPRERSGKQIDE